MSTDSVRQSRALDLLVIAGGGLLGVAAAFAVGRLLPGAAASGLQAIPGAGAIGNALRGQATAMALPAVGDTQAYWFMARAGGIVAYVLLFIATFWGVVMSGRIAKGKLMPAFVYGMHQFFPILALVFALFHAGALLGDHFIGFQPADLLIPFTAAYEPFWTGLGQVAVYLLAALIASFYVKRWIGRRAWRSFHYLSYVAFFLAMVHGIMAGSDAGLPSVRVMYWVTGLLIVVGTVFRIMEGRSQKRMRPLTAPAAGRWQSERARG